MPDGSYWCIGRASNTDPLPCSSSATGITFGPASNTIRFGPVSGPDATEGSPRKIDGAGDDFNLSPRGIGNLCRMFGWSDGRVDDQSDSSSNHCHSHYLDDAGEIEFHQCAINDMEGQQSARDDCAAGEDHNTLQFTCF